MTETRFCPICFVNGEAHCADVPPTEHLAFVTDGGGIHPYSRNRVYFAVRVPRPLAQLLRVVFK